MYLVLPLSLGTIAPKAAVQINLWSPFCCDCLNIPLAISFAPHSTIILLSSAGSYV